jgi:hypothetical protein
MRGKTKANILIAAIVIGLAAAAAGIDALAAHVLYGDYTCAWKRCVEVVKP